MQKRELEALMKLIIDDTQVWNAPEEQYRNQGWKPVVFTECPEAPKGFYYESGWEEGENITQTWTLVENPEPDADEALAILLGEEE